MVLADHQVKRGHPGERVLSVGVGPGLQQQLHHLEVVLLGGNQQRCDLVPVLRVGVTEEGLLGDNNALIDSNALLQSVNHLQQGLDTFNKVYSTEVMKGSAWGNKKENKARKSPSSPGLVSRSSSMSLILRSLSGFTGFPSKYLRRSLRTGKALLNRVSSSVINLE